MYPRSNETVDHDCTSVSLSNLLPRLRFDRVLRCENECRIAGGCFIGAIARYSPGFCASDEKNDSTRTTTTGTIPTNPIRIRGRPRMWNTHTETLLIICRRLSTSREESSPERFFFSSYSRFSFFTFTSSLSSFYPLLCVSVSVLSFFFHAEQPIISVRLHRNSLYNLRSKVW